MTPVTYRRPVFYYETDRMDCVHHSNYIRWFEEARIHLMKVKDFSYESLEASGILSPVLKAEAEYKFMCRFGETVLIDTAIESYTGTRITFTYTVREAVSGQLRCMGKTSHCFLNEKGRPVSLKKALPAYDEAVRAAMEEPLVKIFPIDENLHYKFVVNFSRCHGKWLFSRHKERSTWETQGGHVEPGETPEQAAARELREESGAADFSLTPAFAYSVGDDPENNGVVFLADIKTLGTIPESEMAEVKDFDALPENLTYPQITPVLYAAILATLNID